MNWSRTAVQHAIDLPYEQFVKLYPDASHDAWQKKRYNFIHGRLPLSQQVPTPPPARSSGLQAPIEIPLTDCIVMADLHVPYHNIGMLDRAMQIAGKFNITTLVIAGDLLNFDQISKHPHTTPHVPLNDELALAGSVLRVLMEWFEHIYIISGNHDVRLAKKVDKEISLRFVIDGALGEDRPQCNLHVSDYSRMHLGETWLIGHPSRYSQIGGKTPADIALVVQRNVVGSHNHIVGMMQSKDGRFVGIDPGHMTDPERHAYHRVTMPGQYAAWSSGFMAIVQDKPFIFNSLVTDWNFWIPTEDDHVEALP